MISTTGILSCDSTQTRRVLERDPALERVVRERLGAPVQQKTCDLFSLQNPIHSEVFDGLATVLETRQAASLKGNPAHTAPSMRAAAGKSEFETRLERPRVKYSAQALAVRREGVRHGLGPRLRLGRGAASAVREMSPRFALLVFENLESRVSETAPELGNDRDAFKKAIALRIVRALEIVPSLETIPRPSSQNSTHVSTIFRHGGDGDDAQHAAPPRRERFFCLLRRIAAESLAHRASGASCDKRTKTGFILSLCITFKNGLFLLLFPSFFIFQF